MLLLPIANGGRAEWKIWIMSTWLESLDVQSEDETLLSMPGRQFNNLERFDTDVFIIGAGNAAIALAARLKALGVESVMAERNANVGDNWALRYDCMRFHLPTAFCELPYMCYDKHLQYPHLLTRDDLADQVRRYVAAFNLNVITSTQIKSTLYDQSSQRWTITFQTPAGQRTAVSKHLVQATGIGSQKPYLPPIADRHLYKGISLHSAQYKSAAKLKEQGVKTVLIIGSANTAFDVLEDCHAAGLTATLVARSPTYLIPLSYITSPLSLGAYDSLSSVAAADALFLTLPSFTDAHLSHALFASFAAQEPHRYAAVAAAGFPIVDSRDKKGVLMHHLLERAGGHYVDVGGTRLIAEGGVRFDPTRATI
ncbi:hypothetical protein SLS55_003005 [Diplodia seriata]|uniref:Monooxygenase n=1 Tax=Diplodia seriata TaxID=420778 RepID=A0ABR3CLT8_9PEZI